MTTTVDIAENRKLQGCVSDMSKVSKTSQPTGMKPHEPIPAMNYKMTCKAYKGTEGSHEEDDKGT